MRLIVFLAIIVLIVVIAYLAVAMVKRYRYARSIQNAEWEVQEIDGPDSTEFWLVKGETRDFVGRALRSKDDYSTTYMEMQEEAAEEMYERNSARQFRLR